MKQGTTYPIIITVDGVDLTGAEWIILSIKPHLRPMMEFSREDMLVAHTGNSTTLTLTLTQEQSIGMGYRKAVFDLNWMMDGIRGGCLPEVLDMSDTLLKRAVEDN